MIKGEQPCKLRKLQYLLEAEPTPRGKARDRGTKKERKGTRANLTKVSVKRILHDWSVTIGVHPWALGVDTERQGNVTVPPGLTIHCEIVPNIFKDEIRTHGLKGDEAPIPARINSITLKMRQGYKLRAIMITEHRNLDFASIDVKRHMEDVLLIQVYHVPIFFFSDHDSHGQHIFTGLKYGSMAGAWASATQVCSRLQWAGPTVQHLHATVDNYAPIRREERRTSNPGITGQDAAAEETKWKTLMHQKIDSKLRGKPITKDDREIYRGMVNSGVLRDEPELEKDMKAMIEKNQKFSLTAFESVRPHGAELYILERLSTLAPPDIAAPIVNPIVQLSQATSMFNAADSQTSSDETTPRKAAAARTMQISMD
ncbi:hypothetical protein G7Y79_00024g054830 [Physcia stellaris]|nr:hypothetical protein G7Y79_00024g054830 [Physcia stellaris]